jgi:DNA-binding LacI/PurR family transcriptional regulator
MNSENDGDSGVAGGRRHGYKFQRLREQIRQSLSSGELSGKLPGERELARRFGANAKTISKALNDLSSEGLLIRRVGRGTFVASLQGPPFAIRAMKRYAWILASDRNYSAGLAVFERAQEVAHQDRHEVVLRTVKTSLDGMLPEHALAIDELREFDGLVLFAAKPSRELLAELLRLHIPLVLVEVQHESIRTNCVLTDFSGGAFALCEYLIALGHRDIRLAIDSEWLPCAAVAEVGYRSSMIRHALTSTPAIVTNPAAAPPVLFGGEAKPAALLCVGTELARSVVAEASRQRVQIPWDLSLAVLAEPGQTMPEHLGLTAYQIEAANIANWVLQLLNRATPGQMPQMIVVPGQVVDRGSCRPPLAPTAPTIASEGIV